MATKRIGKIGYAIYDNSVLAEDKYKVSHMPSMQFKTRKQAKVYAIKKGMTNYKIFKVKGLSAKMVGY